MDGKLITQDPMQMPSWSLGMACVWIVYRSPTAAADTWAGRLEDAWLTLDDDARKPTEQPGWEYIDESPIYAMQEARAKLKIALIENAIEASGLQPNGHRVKIPHEQWEDIEFSYELRTDEGMIHRAHNAAGQTYTDLLISRADVLRLWPAEVRPETTGEFKPRKRGPKPDVLPRVKSEMVAHGNMQDLADMTEEAMAAQFGASRDTCRRAREEVLSQLSRRTNSDK